jgi:hypothetical protein
MSYLSEHALLCPDRHQRAPRLASPPSVQGDSLMSTHPHFDDHGAVPWFRDYRTALAEAKKTGKRLFIESGRQV